MSTAAASLGLQTSTPAPISKQPLWRNLGFQVIIAMILGAAVGFLFPSLAIELEILGDIFLRLIKTAVAPLVFLCVAAGIVSAGDFKRVGKVGLVAMIYFEIVSTIALAFGLVAGNLLGVGKGIATATAGAGVKPPAAPGKPQGALDFILNIFPDNFLGAFTRGELLQVLAIAIIFGAALLRLRSDKRQPIEAGLNRMSEVLFEFIHIIMSFAPIGTFGAVAFAVGSSGTAVLLSLIYLVLSFYAVVALFIVAVLGTVCALFGINLFRFLRYIRDEIFIVLGTASSESVLPRLLEKLPQLGCSRQCAGLVLPTGYAFNLDGTSIYMSMGVLFLANAYNVPLDFSQQLGILALMLITSKGAATVSGGTFVVFAATVTATGVLPLEGLAVLFGVYRFMSIAVATTNVIGNAVATVVTAKLCGEFDEAVSQRVLRMKVDVA
ncbi:cation:dicarboxylase symporter family transporter [Bradyrhizobium viridifuturi]|jgi:aerobic C4-dicarboxylate transport protein|uniref:cation:dicarboxylate symporter family transporter n=2 Tax=Nitrobacteraceae TaxID=41294 RepID=UPI000396FE44|nr:MULTISPECIES: cation:dicarboxylase symporter family transporter [Bradyrhizobium]ERF81107.1 MAG: glutamate/aspartate transport system permease [Bradyrhizobium sp. DFCI-1]OYU59317.1 MAG: dicarboxylate/amino acid:cation symporter [Bradyrhizobium sp. PARBB1]PSO17560.1 dicarboxylate/amino acid:cation symporter [Bradyrhizobium sp. MOS004]QRI68197.1 cation:dicarboxylase symporter family transporter [Bradyrhizobium sp. PSBB068]MBR1024435.1 cation:dicarboxylase symporter family transporter [Bradyrhi